MTVNSDDIAARISSEWTPSFLDKATPLILVDLVNALKDINKTLQSMDSSLGKIEDHLDTIARSR